MLSNKQAFSEVGIVNSTTTSLRFSAYGITANNVSVASSNTIVTARDVNETSKVEMRLAFSQRWGKDRDHPRFS